MAFSPCTDAATRHTRITAERLRHVRWLAGGTGSGKSTLARALAERCDADIYDGDRAEHAHLARSTPQGQPRLLAVGQMTPAQRWLGRSPTEIFEAMPSRYGETFGFVLSDVLDRATDQPLIVDDFRTLHRDIAALLTWPEQAAFLLPTANFRRSILARRYADPDRARANWGDLDAATVLEARLARDSLWDAFIRDQAPRLGLPVLEVDGNRSIDDVADQVADQFRLSSPEQ